jgi:hypothetical protein
MMEMILQALREAWFGFVDGVSTYTPRVLALLFVALLGWLVAAALAFVTRHLLAAARFNALAKRFGAEDLLRASELPAPNVMAASLVFWLVWVGFLLSGVDAIGFAGAGSLTADFMQFIPRLLVAVMILAVGMLAATFAWRATLLAAVNARLPSARLVSAGVRSLIVILAVAMALEQIAVATTVVLTAFAIAFGAVMLALAIAFGIGGGDIARRTLEHQFPERERPEPGAGASHL